METAGELAPPLKDKAWRDQKMGGRFLGRPFCFVLLLGC